MTKTELLQGFDFTDPDVYAARLPTEELRATATCRAGVVERAAAGRRRLHRRRVLGGEQAP